MDAAISQTHSLRVDNWLISLALALRASAGRFCVRKKTSRRVAEAPKPSGAEGFNCSWGSTGIRLSSNHKLIRQPVSQIAKTERTISEVAANLAMEEHQGQGEGQNTNHRKRDQRLTAALMHGWFFEVAVGGARCSAQPQKTHPCGA
jgi:hypothetical protein